MWTDETTELAKSLWESRQHSASHIAVRLGTTRAAVVGKARREGWEGGSCKPGGWNTPYDHDAILARWASNESVRAISKALGIRERTVSDIVYRARLKGDPRAILRGGNIAIRKRPSSRGNRANHGGTVARIAAGSPKVKAPPRPMPTDVPEPVSMDAALLDLGIGMCRWPVNDPPKGAPFLFCGHASFGGLSYCEHHARRAYVPAAARERRAA